MRRTFLVVAAVALSATMASYSSPNFARAIDNLLTMASIYATPFGAGGLPVDN